MRDSATRLTGITPRCGLTRIGKFLPPNLLTGARRQHWVRGLATGRDPARCVPCASRTRRPGHDGGIQCRSTSPGGARDAALALLTTAAVVCGLAAAVPGAAAAPSKSDTRVAPATKASSLGPGRYVVVLAEPGATSYDGGVTGFPATAAAPGKAFDAQSAKVSHYEAHLTRQQDRIADDIGADVISRSTLSASSFTARLTGGQATDLAESRDVLMVVKDAGVLPRHLQVPRVPRPGRPQRHSRRVGQARRRQQGRRRHRGRRARLGHLARVRLLRRHEDRPQPHGSRSRSTATATRST